MSIRFKHDSTSNTVHVAPPRILDLAGIRQYVDAVLNDDEISPGFVEIVDFSEIEDFTFSYRQGVALKTLFARLQKEKGWMGTVALAPTDFQFGMLRMYSVLVGPVVEVRVVRDSTEIPAAVSALRAAQTSESNE